jgi:hypothetical protein
VAGRLHQERVPTIGPPNTEYATERAQGLALNVVHRRHQAA